MFVEKVIENPKSTPDESIKEITNIEKAIDFIENTVNSKTVIARKFISEIHKILVQDLSPMGEGSSTPGALRSINVVILGSNHLPPENIKVQEYFDELLNFINMLVSNQYHLLVMAIAHHRMAWIHPFDNGNGMMVRMLTYALLIKQGFQVKTGRILNPTAMFCMDSDKYYSMLSQADIGGEENILAWCSYVLEGLKSEIEKIDQLLNLDFILEKILLPTLAYAQEYSLITSREYLVLKEVIKNDSMTLKSSDLIKILGEVSSVQRSRIIGRLKEKGILLPLKPKGRIYTIGFKNNYLLRGVLKALEENGFISPFLNSSKIS